MKSFCPERVPKRVSPAEQVIALSSSSLTVMHTGPDWTSLLFANNKSAIIAMTTIENMRMPRPMIVE